MKTFVIAATSLALSGAALAQVSESPDQDPAVPAQQMPAEQVDSPLGDAALDDAASDAADAAQDAAQQAEDAAAEAQDAADQAEDAGENASGGLAQWGTETTDEPLDETPEGSDSAPATDPAMDPAADPVTDPAADPAADPMADPAADPMADPAADPLADPAADPMADPEAAPVVAPDVSAPSISETNPGTTGSWLTNRRIWTTNGGDTSAAEDGGMSERPEDWQDIAKVQDVVLDDDGQVVGYLADIGGFLGIGAKQVLLGTDALVLTNIEEDWFFLTSFTKEELQALPDFETASVRR